MYAALAARAERRQHEGSSHMDSSRSSTMPVKGLGEADADSSAAEKQGKAAVVEQSGSAFNAAKRWLNEPGREGIGLQACKLVVASESDLMGGSPATYEARTPWWRER